MSHLTFSRSLFILTFFLLFPFLPVQALMFRGVVLDKVTGDALIGATVVVKERPSLGTATGLDGSFLLKDLPESEETTLVVRYLGYSSSECVVNAKAGSVKIELEPEGQTLNEVLVEGKVDRTSDMGARYLERNAPAVMNVLSAKSIELSPDLTVAHALQRLSGVTMERSSSGSGQYAVLRGMDKRYNYTLVNGVKIPSPDKERYIALDIFPSEMLDRLEVTKSLTPDMEGDATGGVVNLVMKEAPTSTLFNVNASIGYNSIFFDHRFMLYDRSGLMNQSPRGVYGSGYSATLADFKQGALNYSERAALPDFTAGLSWGDRFFNDRLGLVVAGSFQNFNRGTESLFFEDNMPQNGESAVHLTSMSDRFYSEMKMQYALHVKSDFRLNARNTFSLYALYVGNNSVSVRDSKITDLSLNYVPEKGNSLETLEKRSIFERQNIVSLTLQGNHKLNRNLSADWSLVWANATDDMPDRTYVRLENDRNDYVDKIRADEMERRWEKNSDRDLSAAANFQWKYEAFVPLSLKWGGLYRDKARTNDYVSYLFSSDGRQYQGIDFTDVTEIAWKLQATQGSVGPLDYDAHERIGAAYLMYTMGNEVWTAIAGVRAEHTDQGYYMYFPDYGDDPNGGQTYWDILPSVNLKYSPIKDMNLRLSYFRSINRPGFFEMVPYTIIKEDYTEFGNKDLKRARIDNVDLRWEWFPSVTDQVMVGLFYKHIEDPIEYAYYSVNSRQFGYGPANLGNAQNMGVEIDLIKYFRWFGIKANYTYTHSRITTSKTLYSRENGSLERLSVDQSRPLVGQAPHVANLSLLYKNSPKGWDAQLSFTYTGEKMAVVSHYYKADYWDSPLFSLDASAEKKIGRFSIYAKATNLLNSHYKRYIKTTSEYNLDFPSQNDNRTLIYDNYSGIGFLVGVRYKL